MFHINVLNSLNMRRNDVFAERKMNINWFMLNWCYHKLDEIKYSFLKYYHTVSPWYTTVSKIVRFQVKRLTLELTKKRILSVRVSQTAASTLALFGISNLLTVPDSPVYVKPCDFEMYFWQKFPEKVKDKHHQSEP